MASIDNALGLGYKETLLEIMERIKKGQYNALKAVNTELITLYRDIGRIISEAKSEKNFGDSVINILAHDIKVDNPGIKGFSRANLFRMIRFYETYRNEKTVSTLSRQITWSHNVLLLDRCKDMEEVEYYMNMSIKYGWSYRVLMNKIAFKDYERSLNSQNNFDLTIAKKYRNQAKLAVKDEYIFDFLELGQQHSERELENSISQNIEKFLKEMNNCFLYVGKQYRIEVEGNEYFIDLLLFHRPLKCFVAIELKVGEFKPEYAGKMSFYLTTLDRQIKTKDENKSIGIIICKEKNRTIVEYTLTDIGKPMTVSTFKSHNDLPIKYAKYLPDENEIGKRLLHL